MQRYFDSNSESQHVFVLHGLGGSGKSQLAFKFLQDCQANDRYAYMGLLLLLVTYDTICSFSEIFYADATNEQTLEADLKAIVPGSAQWSMDASWRWLESQCGKTWLLLFDNVDDMELDLGKFIPPFGNTLITTRNPQLCIHAGEDGDSRVQGMDFEDSKALLLHLSGAAPSDENKKLAELIVVVCP